MIGEIRYWWAGDAYALCLAESDVLVTAAWWGGDGMPLGVVLHERRFWERFVQT